MRSMKRNSGRFHYITALTVFFTASALLFPQEAPKVKDAVIRGKIIDSMTAEPVFGATVLVRAEKSFAQTDFDGNYSISVSAGTHDLEVQMIGFDPVKRRVTVTSGQSQSINITLGVTELDVVQVTGRALNNTEASMLSLQKKSGSVSDGITSEAIKKSPDSNAGDVLKRVTGITLVGGKYVFVRGLGERYSNTVVNDMLVASPESERRVIPMDMFPAGLIKNIRVMKTATAEDPAEFSGGLVKVETKEYPDTLMVEGGAGLGYNSNTTQKTMKLRKGGGNEYLGFHNDILGLGTDYRSQPELVEKLPGIIAVSEGNNLNKETVALIHSQYNQNWSPESFQAEPGRNMSVAVGNSYDIFTNGKFGYVVGSSYSRSWHIRDVEERRWVTSNAINYSNSFVNENNQLYLKNSYKTREYTEDVTFGNNVNITVEPVNGQKISSKTMYSVQSENYFHESDIYKGENRVNIYPEVSGFISREMVHQVFSGKHAIGFLSSSPHFLDWDIGYSEANRNEPDMKWRVWERQSESLTIPKRSNQERDGYRAYSETQDIGKTFKLSYEIPFKQWSGLSSKLKFGGMTSKREKAYDRESYTYRTFPSKFNELPTDNYKGPGEITLNPARVFSGELQFQEDIAGFPSYHAIQELKAYFTQVDLPLIPKLRLVTGVRYEDSYQKTRTYNPLQVYQYDRPHYGCDDYSHTMRKLINSRFPGTLCPADNNGIGELKTADMLPSFNLTYEATKDMNIRVAYSETITRPDLRELSEFGFSPAPMSDRVFGNFELERTYIHNYDLRWEWYINQLDYIGVGLFHKHFSSPIESMGRGITATGVTEYQYYNADSGHLTGLELEVRKDLFDFFRLEVNAFLIRSKVEVMPWAEKAMILTGNIDPSSREALFRPTNLERPMQGQSPHVINTKAVFFLDKEKTHSLGVYYNVFGDRIRRVGANGAPDIYEQGVGLWDIVYSVEPIENFSIKLSAKNVTDERFRWYQTDLARKTLNDFLGYELLEEKRLYNSYRDGVNWSLSGSYKF